MAIPTVATKITDRSFIDEFKPPLLNINCNACAAKYTSACSRAQRATNFKSCKELKKEE